ncbi:MAG TPA: penicillin-binding transpeptidase domain-containing protein [Acidobacteriaceae bacterium]|nr:penicillin-binding transpeptidase domain-containing protein [Acidobacteriaceae bacterium]
MSRLNLKHVLHCLLFLALGSFGLGRLALANPTQPVHHTRTHSTHLQESARARRHMARLRHSRPAAVQTASLVTVRGRSGRLHRVVRRHRYYEHFTASSFTESDIAAGDITAGEDPVVRQAAIDALGNMVGTAVAIDPSNGRILAMVNQKLALSSGAEPCSTIKISVALAALQEGIVTKDTQVNLGGRYHMDMTQALAHSNNLYFETLGRRLGFERVHHYATQFGLGELAGWNIPDEQLGSYPDHVLPESEGGVGKMCSFGQGISMTPLQLGAMVAAIANGGTLYYLQHPETPAEAVNFQPKVKRVLDIGKLIPEITTGMEGAVDYGTARSLHANFKELPILGKTGTCSDNGTRYGWFASFADTSYGRIVTVFFLEGGRPTFGPKAAELSGIFYRNLWDLSYFAQKAPAETTTTPVVAAGANQ